MKNLKMISAFAILFMALSCNDDENSDQNPEENGFFSEDVLKVGNKWVYKRYDNDNYAENPQDFHFSGRIDSVEVIGSDEVNGVKFFTLRKRSFNSAGVMIGQHISYERINNSTHWMRVNPYNDSIQFTEESGGVRHPGEDFNYFRHQEYDTGELTLRLYSNEVINVEGVDYEVAPFKGTVIPNEAYPPNVPPATLQYDYNKDVGFVRMVCPSIHGTSCFEIRLASFTPAE